MKEFIKSIKENPKEALTTFLSTLTIFGFGYALIFLAAILDGNV